MRVIHKTVTSFIFWVFKCVKTVWALRLIGGSRLHRMLTELHGIWGDRFRFPLGRGMATVMSDPKDLDVLFEHGSDVLSAGEGRRRLIGVLPPQAMIYQQGWRHKRARTAVARSFNRTMRTQAANSLVRSLVEKLRDGGLTVESIKDYCDKLASHFVIGKVDQDFGEKLRIAADCANKMNPSVLAFPILRRLPFVAKQFAKMTQTRGEFLEVMDSRMNDIANESQNTSLTASLLQIGSELGMDREEIRDNLGMIAMAIAFNLKLILINTLHALADNSDWQNRLREAVLDGQESASDANSLSRAIVKECLRLSPAVPLISRYVKQDVVINGMKLKKGQFVFASPWLTHFREAGYKNARKFDPSRFLNGQQHGYNYIPFGGGSNHCLGSGWTISVVASAIEQITSELHLSGENCGSAGTQFQYEGFNLIRRRIDVKTSQLSKANRPSTQSKPGKTQLRPSFSSPVRHAPEYDVRYCGASAEPTNRRMQI